MDRIGSDAIDQIFELIGARLTVPVQINIAGSLPALLAGLTSRPTDVMGLIGEVPSAIRSERVMLRNIKKQCGFTLGTFDQTRPTGSLGAVRADSLACCASFGRLDRRFHQLAVERP